MKPANEMLAQRTCNAAGFDVARVRRDFPILGRSVYGKPLVYLDSAATAQKPLQVINAVSRFYEEDYSNVHRGLHSLSQRATELYEHARQKACAFIGASDAREIIFVRGCTEGINLVAQSFGRANIGAGDEIVITGMEHHSNIVPWQILCEEKGALLRVAPFSDEGELLYDELERLIGPKTKLVCIAHVSNALGTINPIKRIIEMAHAHGARVLVDGAQAVPHMKVDVKDLGCDFYAFSGHKMYGPTGIGVLYGRLELLEEMPPYQGGGEMIRSVTFEKTTYNAPPHRFEAGTPNIVGAIGLAAAIEYLEDLGLDAITAHEHELLTYATDGFTAIPHVRLIGTASEKGGILSFVVNGVHPHDVATVLDREGIAVRAGHHCAQPAMERFGLAATVRASFGLYNTKEEIDFLITGMRKVLEVFA